jgi:hypothetical protein
MRPGTILRLLALPLLVLLNVTCTQAQQAQAAPEDPGWPRVFAQGDKTLTVYQPQVDSWTDYQKLHFRCAISVRGGGLKREAFGVAEIDAVTVTDQDARVVSMIPGTRDLRFPNLSAEDAARARRIVDELRPMTDVTTLSLDRLLAYVDVSEQAVQKTVELNLDAPRIFASRTPAILVIFLGEPEFAPVAPDRTDLMFALNTNWDLLFDTGASRYYLLDDAAWLTAPDALKGPWAPATQLPAVLSSLPADDNWAEVRARIPGQPPNRAPAVFATTEPAELIVTDGEPSFRPIPGTRLMEVANTDSLLFLHSTERSFYFLVAGRWFRAPKVEGPWSGASLDLPPDFAAIPDDHPLAFVRASVPGTREAEDAVLLASVPTTMTVDLTAVAEQVGYSGTPKFVPVEGTSVQSAVNTTEHVFLVDGVYYWCSQGAWLTAASPNGPWTFATMVPAAIYTLPPSHPSYNVTYITVESSTPTTVTYNETAGYSGQYVASNGVLMFGVGLLVGAALADDDDHHHYYYPPYYYPRPVYSYGYAAHYDYAYGGYYRSARVYGPYGGAGAAAGYNPVTGTYARSAYAYGPYGAAGVRQAYNPYTGAYAHRAAVSTAYGSASRGVAYNPRTGTAVAGRRVDTAYGSAGGFYAERGGKSAWGGYRSGEYGSAAGFGTSEGAGAAAWDTRNSQGAVAKTRSGDVFVGHDDTVYRREEGGSWSQNTGSGWQDVDGPQPAPSAEQRRAGADQPASPAQRQAQPTTQQRDTAATQQRDAAAAQQQAQQRSAAVEQRAASAGGQRSGSREQLESQARARQYGNQQSQRVSQYRSGSSPAPRGGSQRRN